MLKKRLRRLPIPDVAVKGWLLNQLNAQKDGLTGNVRFLFSDLSDNSAWLGGNGECWERGPYYLDGLLPLAYLTQDETLKKEASKWIESIFASQRADGNFGPKKNGDWWPRMVVTKMLPTYYELTGDERVIKFLSAYYGFMLKNLDDRPLYNWANSRGIEEFVGIDFLFSKTGDKKLVELAEKIYRQTIDYIKVFSDFPYKKPSSSYIKSLAFNAKKAAFYAGDFLRNTFSTKEKTIGKEKINARNAHPFNVFYHLTHGVNLAMALKYPALCGALFSDPKMTEKSKAGYLELMKYHGTAAGLFTGDEHLSGAVPTQGIELCTVAEAMYSAEVLYELSGDAFWADLLELLAYNTFPATFTPDMCAHQYVQQVNQISATTAKRKWYDSYNKANIFGLKPNYACCLSNMHQGFPKFAQHLAFYDGDAIILLAPLAMSVDTKVAGARAAFEVESDYPFSDKAKIKISEGNFVLKIRLAKNVSKLKIGGKEFSGVEYAEIKCAAGDQIDLKYEFKLNAQINPDGSASLYLGSLLLAQKIKSRVQFKREGDRFSDREFFPQSDWNYALLLNERGGGLTVGEGAKEKDKNIKIDFLGADKSLPYASEQISVKVPAVKIDWKQKNNQADAVPDLSKADARALSQKQTYIELVPYGAATLRIAQFPYVKIKD
jgi:hypothetical protein